MNPRTIILAFLAARYPGAYKIDAVTARVNASGMLEKPATELEVQMELQTLANKFQAVEPDINKTSGEAYWSATPEGVKMWNLDGRQHVG